VGKRTDEGYKLYLMPHERAHLADIDAQLAVLSTQVAELRRKRRLLHMKGGSRQQYYTKTKPDILARRKANRERNPTGAHRGV
jgi:hypothetical protein